MKKILLAIGLSLMLCVGALAESTTEHFQKILDDHWAAYLSEYPAFAARLGHHEYDGKLGQNTPQARERRQNYNAEILTRLAAINPDDLTKAARLNYDIFQSVRLMEQESAQFPGHLFAVTNREGWHMSFAQMPGNMSFLEQADYDNYLGQMADYPRFNDENMAALQEAVDKGYTQYCPSMAGYETSISSHVVTDVTKSVFYAPFRQFPGKISPDKQKEITKRGVALINNKVIPAYKKFYDFYQAVYAPACRKTVGITSLKGGKDYYAHLIRYFTTTNMTPGEIHQKGLSEVKRLRGEMAKIIKKVGFKGSFKEFITFLRTDPRFYTDDPQDLMEKAALIAKRMDGQLPKLFGFLPRNPYGLKEIPADIAEKTTTAYYMPSGGNGKTAGNYFVNTSLLKTRPLYTQEALGFHEAVPGHHLQIAIQKELDMPMFRKYAGFTAFVEGWALYSKRLGLEVGFYTDPYSDFGRLTYEMWRACRLVVDTGMHTKGWSRQQAIDYMVENTSLSVHNITTEVDRYITWPGQALAYKIGELSITALRHKAERDLGDKFDLRAFHDTVLGNGALPIAILEKIVTDWIQSQK